MKRSTYGKQMFHAWEGGVPRVGSFWVVNRRVVYKGEAEY